MMVQAMAWKLAMNDAEMIIPKMMMRAVTAIMRRVRPWELDAAARMNRKRTGRRAIKVMARPRRPRKNVVKKMTPEVSRVRSQYLCMRRLAAPSASKNRWRRRTRKRVE